MDIVQTIEPLRPYASDPPRSSPPEILPWHHGGP